ncbi:PliI family lysozyme inhibitor of I-type lysozyme, partial [Draconibacterium sp.]|nr:PliI family lysozyme inhibitor of I-type lysozyme [Draconibacterium sp.]
LEGNYVTSDYAKRNEGYDWVAASITQWNDSVVHISIRSRADKKKPTCTFDANAVKQDSTGLFKAMVDGNSILFLFARDKLTIKADTENANSNLNYFCSGGASIEGVYSKLEEPLDTAQIDKAVFRKSLNYDKFNFFIEVYRNTLTIEPVGLTVDNQTVTHEIEGTLMNAEVGDLNIDGFPEVLVYIQSAGSGSYGSVIGYSVNNGKSMSQIAPLPEVSENPKANTGYMGHDEFAIVENTLVQRFPVYKPDDVNANPTGGMRQLQYKLKDGEASRLFIVDRIIEY